MGGEPGVTRAGSKGEQKTEELLNGFALKAAVLHDLRVPLPGFKSNIDHAVVSGSSVLLIPMSSPARQPSRSSRRR